MKKAVITGVNGQDGSYLAEFLLEKGYRVFGMRRRSSSSNTERIDHILNSEHPFSDMFSLHHFDLIDSGSMMRMLATAEPDEIYHLAAQSHVAVSFETPEYTANADALGTMRLLEAVKNTPGCEKTRIYQASTSELYGKVQEVPQSEKTPFYPRSPYGVAKLYAYWITVNYREAYGMFASNGILFNHESPRRGETFVSRKITMGVAQIAAGKQECLYLGNLDSRRDWGHARDYVEAIWKVLQHNEPDDFVIATGNMHSVRELAALAFEHINKPIYWEGSGLDEVGKLKEDDRIVIRIDPAFFRPAEVDELLGDASKAKSVLGWEPKISFEELVREMMDADLSNTSR